MDRQRIIEQLTKTKLAVGERAYAVVHELGRGGNGVAFLCRAADGQECVSKVYIPPDTRDLDETAFKRFENEIALTEKLKHPNIVPSLGSSYASIGAYKLPFYLMPVAIGTLRNEIRQDTDPHRLERKFRLFLRASHGIACLHSHGIVHRDLKPENILISKNGVPWIADLGIAHVNSDFVTMSIRTAEDERLLNRDYYAPEQRFEKLSAVDHRADIYALGIILYELLTSIPPVRANTPSLGEFSSAFKPIEPIWERMTAWQASARYQQIEDVLEDLSIVFGLVLAMLRGDAGLQHPDVSVMSKLLRSNSPEHRQQGLDLAIRLGRTALPTLHSLIGHSKPEVKNWCIRALGAIADPSSLRYLVAELYNEGSQSRRRRSLPFVDTAAEAINRYLPEERLRALRMINQKVEINQVTALLGDFKSSAVFDAILDLRNKNYINNDDFTLKTLISLDEDRAWPEVESQIPKSIDDAIHFLSHVNLERKRILLDAWIKHKPVYGWRFKYMIEAVARSPFDISTRTEWFNILEQNMKSFSAFSERTEYLKLLEAARSGKAM